MTQKNNFPVPVFRDEKQEQQTIKELETARNALQELADTWRAMDIMPFSDIAPLSDLTALLADPQKFYDRALAAVIEPPRTGGKYQQNKAEFIRTLDVPTPSGLIKLAAEVRKVPHAINPQLWNLEDDLVTIHEAGARPVIAAATVYAMNQQQLDLATDLQTVCDKLNSIDDRLSGEILHQAGTTFLSKLFDVVTESYPGPARLRLSPDKLRQLFNQYLPQ